MRLARSAPWLALAAHDRLAPPAPAAAPVRGGSRGLFPDDPAAKALGAYVDAFGGGDVTIVLVRGDDPRAVAAAAEDIAKNATGKPGVKSRDDLGRAATE